MPETSFKRFYQRAEFIALVGSLEENISRIRTAINELVFVADPPNIELTSTARAVVVTWGDYPPEEDLAAVDAAVTTITGGATTGQPVELNSLAVATTTSGSDQLKIDHTTEPLEAGTYQVLWLSNIRMQAVIANTGVQARFRGDRSDGASYEQTDAWDLANNHAFNGALTFTVLEGQTIRTRLAFARLGASGTAEMSNARITIDKIS